jgi:signal peptidase I
LSKRSRTAPKPKNVVAQVRAKSGASSRPRTSAWEHARGIGSAILIFLFLRTFFIEAYRIPSGSMIPTLLVGDWLFVNKLVYGPHLPFTSINFPGYSNPRRFDVAVFVSPNQIDQPWDPNPTLVKRVIGLPGDTLFMRDSKLFINGKADSSGYGAASDPGNPNYVDPLFDWQKRVALKDTRFGPPPEQPSLDNWGPLLVPARHYFMMGDNRYNSKDSRYWSFVPRENFRGRPMFVYYSYVPSDESERPISFVTDIRWLRLGHWIR